MSKSTKQLQAAISNLDGFFKVGAKTNRQNIPTGHWELDYALQYGSLPGTTDLSSVVGYDPKKPLGLPRGRAVQLYGLEGCGKSSLAYRVCGNAQKMGLTTAWVDTQHSYEESLAEINGVNVQQILYSDCYSQKDAEKVFWAEDVLDGMVAILRKAKQINLGVLVLDSVANLIPSAIGQESANKDTMALLARVLGKTVPKICSLAAKHNVLVIFINQLRQKPGVMYGDPLDTPGGKVVKFNSSVRLKMTKRTADDSIVWAQGQSGLPDDRRIVGRISSISIDKNRCSKPLLDSKGKRIAIPIPIFYERYFPGAELVAFDQARKLKIVSIRNGIFSWKREGKDDVKVQGRIPFVKYLVNNDIFEQFVNVIKQQHQKNKSVAPPQMQFIDFKSIKKRLKDLKQHEKMDDGQVQKDDSPPVVIMDGGQSQQLDFDEEQSQTKIKIQKKGKKK